jgi:hypothetical protein
MVSPVLASAHLAASPASPVDVRSSQPAARGANRLHASCKRLSREVAPAHTLPNLQRSGHQAAVTPLGVNQQRRQRCQDLLCDRRGYATRAGDAPSFARISSIPKGRRGQEAAADR